MAEKTILVVDDTPENIAVLSAVVAPLGKVKAATNGEKALRICSVAPPPDLVFLDILMPGMDGWQVCEALKADAATAAIPVVFVTGTASEADRGQASSLGAAGLLTKPLDAAAVRALGAKLLG